MKHVFLQLSWKSQFGTNRAYLHLETLSFQEVFLSKTHSILTGKNVLSSPACSLDGFLSRYTCVSSTQLNCTFWKKISLCTPLKLWILGSTPFRDYSILKGRQCSRCCSF
jgi:hypothetical protein